MRAIVQRIKCGEVRVDGEVVGKASVGFMVLVGFNDEDVTSDTGAHYIADKIMNLRLFQDDADKMNLSIKDIDGDLLIVPNFTLYGDCRKGRRPSFSASAKSDVAASLFETFVRDLKKGYDKVETGKFKADMEVDIINDGPVTVILDSEKIV